MAVALTFRQMVADARRDVEGVGPAEARRRIQEHPNMLVIDVQDPDDARTCGLIPGGINISLGMLPIRADHELHEALRAPQLHDFSRPILVTCGIGGQATLAAQLLKRMGYTDVIFLEGGTAAWKAQGFAVERPA